MRFPELSRVIRNEEGKGMIPAESPSPLLRMRRSAGAPGAESRLFPGRSMIRAGEESSEDEPASFSTPADRGRSADRISRGLEGCSFPANAVGLSLRIRTPPRPSSGSTRSEGFGEGLSFGTVFVN